MYLIKWQQFNQDEPSFSQESLKVFLIAHLFLAKSDYAIISRFVSEADPKNKSLFAAAETYYWLNKANENLTENKKKAITASQILFDSNNRYGIESVYQLRHALLQSSIYQVFELEKIVTIESVFSDQVVTLCRRTLENREWQSNIFDFPKNNEETNMHAIWLLENYGSIIDLDLLRPLSDHPAYGKAAVEAIKKLTS